MTTVSTAKQTRKSMGWVIFVAGAVLSWGAYGALLHMGQTQLGNPLKALLCVGVAYFLIGVLIPVAALASSRDAGQRWRVVPRRHSLWETGRRLATIRVSGDGDRRRAVIEPDLRELQSLVVVIPEIRLKGVVEQSHSIQNAIAVDVGVDEEQVLGYVVEG